MAVVYKATDPVIGRVVAIKTIRLEHGIGLEQEELRQRLYREAQSAGNLNHPNIVTIYDIGEEGDLSYIAMEFIEGISLEDWMEQNRIPPVEVTASIIEQIASGLDYAAARGIIHRDIKPGNILLTSDIRAKIADFGIAKISTSKFTQTGTVMGTPAYMSPEQALGKTLDGRSDIFSLGVIFYEMLTGERPFTGANATTIIYKIVHEEVVPPARLNTTLHMGYDFIVQQMLAKDPNQRYQSCGAVVNDLKNYAALGPTKKITGMRAPAPATGGRRYGLFALIAVLIIAIGILSAVLYQQLNRKPGIPAAKESAPAPTKQAPAVQQPAPQTPASVLAPEKTTQRAGKEAAATVEKPSYAQVRVAFAGTAYPATLFDGARMLGDVSPTGGSLQVTAGEHRFRIVSEEVFLNRQLERTRLKTDQLFSITLPGLGGAYIEVPNDAFDGCEISLDGQSLPTPYPAQIPRLSAGEHRVTFRWASGKYAGKQFASSLSCQENHHYRVRGEPQNERIVIQQIR